MRVRMKERGPRLAVLNNLNPSYDFGYKDGVLDFPAKISVFGLGRSFILLTTTTTTTNVMPKRAREKRR